MPNHAAPLPSLQVPPADTVAVAAGAAAMAAAAAHGIDPAETVNSPFGRVGSASNLRVQAAAAAAMAASAGAAAAGAAAAGTSSGAAGAAAAAAGPPSAAPPTAEPAAAAAVAAGGSGAASLAGIKRGAGEVVGNEMMRRTRAALNTWQHLQVGAVEQ